ncbi:MAG: ATP-grasp domain-containing protein, partial [Pseudomonadota bacterium]
MNLHEYQAKRLFADYAIPIPEGRSVRSSQDAGEAAAELGGGAWVVKAQVHAGGRGKAGGVKLGDSVQAVSEIAEAMLGTRLVTHQTGSIGLPVETVLVEKVYTIARELYLSALIDRGSERVMFMASSAGGMDIEEVAATNPEKIHTATVNPAAGLQSYQCRNFAYAMGLQGVQGKALESVMRGLYQLLLEQDASQVEINPLVVLEDGGLIALDAKLN